MSKNTLIMLISLSDPDCIEKIEKYVDSIQNNENIIKNEIWVLISEDTIQQLMKSLKVTLIRAKKRCIIRKIYATPEQLNDPNYVKSLVSAIKQDRRTIMIGFPIQERICILLRDWLISHTYHMYCKTLQ